MGEGCCSEGHGQEQGCCDETDWRQEMLLHAVRKARFELIKEKAKKLIEKTEGEKLDKLADLVVKAMKEDQGSESAWDGVWTQMEGLFP
jgi:hypothetical protein